MFLLRHCCRGTDWKIPPVRSHNNQVDRVDEEDVVYINFDKWYMRYNLTIKESHFSSFPNAQWSLIWFRRYLIITAFVNFNHWVVSKWGLVYSFKVHTADDKAKYFPSSRWKLKYFFQFMMMENKAFHICKNIWTEHF